jgi:hypothetical protein
LFNPVVAPNYTNPTLTIAVLGTELAVANGNTLNVEFAANISPTITPTWSRGDAGDPEKYELYQGSTISGSAFYTNYTPTTTPNMNSVKTVDAFTITSPISYIAQVTFKEGAIKNDTAGVPYPIGHIAAGTKNSGVITYSPQRKAFYGVYKEDKIPTNSADIRALTSVFNIGKGSTMTATAVEGDWTMVFAYPGLSLEVESITHAQLGVMTDSFTRVEIDVEGAIPDIEGVTTKTPYTVYYYKESKPFTGNNTLTLKIKNT